MELNITENRTQNGITYINMIARPTKFYDSYQITNIKYKENGEEKSIEQYYLMEEAFYKEINKYEDWQNIDPNSYENYRLLTDLDFAGKNNINNNLRIGKLVTEGSKHIIKNVDLVVGDSYSGLIKESKNGIENIIFENIEIKYEESKSINYVGVIAQNNGYLKNIDFKNIEINVTNKVNYIGCIGNSTGYQVENINLQSVRIEEGISDIGGLFGCTTSGNINNIIADDIHIKGTGSYIGGIVGYIPVVDEDIFENIKVSNSEIIGNKDVGGVVGNGHVTKNVNVNNSSITGISNVGGVMGTSNYYNNSGLGGIEYIYVNNSDIEGETNVGGIGGYAGNLYDTKVINSTISAPKTTSQNIGGIIGELGWTVQRSLIIDSKVISGGSSVGGIIGKGLSSTKCYSLNSIIEGYSNVGGITGSATGGGMEYSYSNSKVTAMEHSVGGLIGYLDNSHMNTVTDRSSILMNYFAGNTIKAKANVGGIVGKIGKELDTFDEFYKNNYVEADLICDDETSVSLGIGSNPEENVKFKNTYYYKYSTINRKNPNEENEQYIDEANYLKEEDLKKKETYTSKLAWNSNFVYDILSQNKYPILQHNNENLPNQNGIDIPVDTEHMIEKTETAEKTQSEAKEQLEQTFEYANKEIQTFSTYSVIMSSDGSKVTRDAKLYVKDNNLYVVPTTLGGTSENGSITPVADNLILDSYNGKEYETVLGSDGKMYDLKEPITYPENFVNSNIESIGNNLNSEVKEVEVTYKNGDKVKFNYQTGEIITASKSANSDGLGLFDYIKDKISEIGNSSSNVTQAISNKYEQSKELQEKLEKTSVEEAIEKQNSANSVQQAENIGTATENDETNNSFKEKKYISMYNEETGAYEIYKEEELLDTSKEEVVSENEKIEANNLNEYYASEGETKNTKLGIVWIVLSIIGVGIILFVLGIRGRSLNPDKKK